MKCLLRAAELIRRQKEELALIETLESGKPITQARDEMDWAAGLWDMLPPSAGTFMETVTTPSDHPCSAWLSASRSGLWE
jgi:acyl-CoA reductase-like NAD-dependent aldehyde dehydrogenase